jgi:hypothetical protein
LLKSFLTGLYPPHQLLTEEVEEDPFSSGGLPYGLRPVPIYSSLRKSDNLLYAYKNCPKFVQFFTIGFVNGDQNQIEDFEIAIQEN